LKSSVKYRSPATLILVWKLGLPGKGLLSKMPRNIASACTNLSPKFVGIAQRQCLVLTLIGVLAFAGSATIGLITGIVAPTMHDEFSYLLAADTFAHGRLTNPTHPMWIHFESFHIIHVPTYMSKYPPAQGAMLALGKVLTGYPIVGVWLTMGLMCAAIYWMLRAWVPRYWASLGGVLSILHPIVGIGGYWAQSYWGGALAATGGALVIGGIRRTLKKPQISHSLLIAAGLTILANTRPFEGLLLSISAMFIVLGGVWSQYKTRSSVLVCNVILPLMLACSISGGWMAYYNYRLTGNALRLPYQVHEETYGIAPLFLWQNPKPEPEYRHERIQNFHKVYAMSYYNEKRSWVGFIIVNLSHFLVYVLLTANVVAIPMLLSARGLLRWVLNNPWGRNAFVTCTILTVGIMLETFTVFHYWAPILSLSYYFIVQGIRLWWHSYPRIRAFIAPGIVFLTFVLMIVLVRKRIGEDFNPLSAQVQRSHLLAQLENQTGKHLVLVKYQVKQSQHREWVYNEADIDDARVVWARDMNRNENCKLIDYFKDRVTWSLNVEGDNVPVKVHPFPLRWCQ